MSEAGRQIVLSSLACSILEPEDLPADLAPGAEPPAELWEGQDPELIELLVELAQEPDGIEGAVEALPPSRRRLLVEAAAARQLVARGLVPADQIEALRLAARELERPIEELAMERGTLDPALAMEFYAALQGTRLVCSDCLSLLAADQAHSCSSQPAARGSGSARERALLTVALVCQVLEPEDLDSQADPATQLEGLELSPDLVSLLADLAPGLSDGTDHLESLIEALPPLRRRVLIEASAQRQLLAGGYVSEEGLEDLLRVAAEQGRPIEELAMEQGTLDPMQAMEFYARIQTLRPACRGCLSALPEGQETCPNCASSTQSLTSMTSYTLDDSAEGANLEAFPGAGGTFGDYELLARVAEGGMGVVFRARDLKLNREVALKVMRGGALASSSRKRRFLMEAESVASLKHPNIVPIHEIGEAAGYPYYTMDFVPGLDLDEHVEQRSKSPQDTARLLSVIASAVHHFHQRGIIHRDLKPDNILVTEAGVPVVIDFGIAKRFSEDESTASHTMEGAVLGTPHYMSPEQAAGRSHEVDVRADVYSMGAILYQLLAGAKPFAEVQRQRLLDAIQAEDPIPLTTHQAGLERDLVAIVEMAMAKECERRYQSALELSQDLARYVEFEPVLARPASALYRARKVLRRHRGKALSAAALLLLSLGALTLWGAERARHRAEIASAIEEARQAPLAQRAQLFAEIQGRDPGNVVARLEQEKAREALAAEEAAAERARGEEQRRREAVAAEKLRRVEEERRRLEAERARERAQAALAERQAKDRARQELAAQAARERVARAEELLERALASQEPLEALDLLGDALREAPAASQQLRLRIEQPYAARALDLAQAALDADQAGLARHWLRQAHKVSSLSPGDLRRRVRTAARLQALTSGQARLAEAKRLIEAGEWLAARTALEQARAQGLSAERVAPDLALIEERCRVRASTLLAGARDDLAQGRLRASFAKAAQAQRFVPQAEEPQALRERAASALADEALRQAHLRARLEPRSGLAPLEEALRELEGTRVVGSLRRELAARRRLLELEPKVSLKGWVYLPQVSPHSAAPLAIQSHEVTNEEFARFVAAGGYTRRELWAPEALPLMERLRDATPGDPQRGPRTWRQGSYGEAANARRPVRGVSLYEAQAYARWLSGERGLRYRLPSASEWELAAGWDPETGALRRYPWGADPATDHVLSGALVPEPIRSRPRDRSPLGAFDLAGSVSEWVHSSEGVGLKGAPFAASPRMVQHLAQVGVTGTPAANPSAALAGRIGFRLVLELEAPQ